MDPLFRRAFKFALSLHGLLIVVAVCVSLMGRCQREPEPLVFELVGAVTPSPSRDSREDPPAELEAFEVESPEPLAEIPDLPKPTDPPLESRVAPKPPPKPEIKAPTPNISIDEWRRNRSVPDQRQVVQKKRPVNTPLPEIDTSIRQRLKTVDASTQVQGMPTLNNREWDALRRYQVLLSQAIERVFEPTGNGLTAQVTFFVDPSGRLFGGRILKSSGVASFDQAVIRALSLARAPGPPPGRETLEFSLTFRSP